MKKATKRIYMSLLLVVLSVFTAVATTFAWVGITSNTTFEKVRINLKENENDNNSEFGIQLSLSGKEGTFYDEINKEDLQKQILLNMGYTQNQFDKFGVSYLYNSIYLEQCTVARQDVYHPFDDEILTDFYDMNGNTLVKKRGLYSNKILEARGFIYFDLYASIYSVSGDSVTTSSPNIFLKNTIMSSDNCSSRILNNVYLPNYFSDPIIGKVDINAANATRVAIQRFEIVDKYDVETYERDSYQSPNKLVIFKNGSDTPVYNQRNSLYDFGGLVDLNNNFAYKYYKSIYGDTFGQLNGILDYETRIQNRGEITFTDGERSDSPNLLLPATMNFNSNQMVKFRVFFWFEGWDGDCMEAINNIPVTLNLEFSTKTNIE